MDGLIRETKEFSPHIIGISITITFAQYAYLLMKELSMSEDLPLVAGGPHPSILPNEALNNGADIVVRGEGEQIFIEIMDYINGRRKLRDILGISFKDEAGKYIHNKPRPMIRNLDSLPFPAKHLFNMEHYVKKPFELTKYGNIITSRGCPFECTYCSNKIGGKKIRFRSPENIISEIRYLRDKYGIKKFIFLDDCATLNSKRMIKLCRMITNQKLCIRWVCITRVDTVDKKLLIEMKKSGCIAVDYGIESGNIETLKKIKKEITIDEVEKTLKWTHKIGIKSMVNFMHGFPWESATDLRINRRFIKKIRPWVDSFMPAGIVIPFPKTDLYEQYKDIYGFENWWLKNENLAGAEKMKISRPFFERIFFSYYTLKENFFNYSPQIVKEIKKTALVIGRYNLLEYSKRISKKPIVCLTIREILFLLVLISKLLYKIDHRVEAKIMLPLSLLAEKYQLQG
jgi:magnesium-protoporphyrin IX monomethyl ester (oxidative) cyclase